MSSRANVVEEHPARLSFADERDVDRFVDMLTRFEAGEVDADQWRAFRLVHGAYGQRQEGTLSMLRVKIPQGVLSAAQLETLAEVAQRYSRGFGHITTRQSVQLHFLQLADVEAAMRQLAAAGLTTREACGNSVRTITAPATAGVAADERFDVTPYAEALTRYLLRHPLSSTLPRKFKIAFSGGGADHAFLPVNDIGWEACVRVDGATARRGFRVTLAGGTATYATAGRVYAQWLPAGQLFEVAEAVVRLFHRLGDRVNRKKNRMKFLVRAMGWDAFVAALDEERRAVAAKGLPSLPFDPDTGPVDGADGARGAASPHGQAPARTAAPLDDPHRGVEPEAHRRLESLLRDVLANDAPRGPGEAPVHLPLALDDGALQRARADWRAHNVRAQRQPGYSLVEVALPLGDITSGRLRLVAELARVFGEGEVRTTHDQNLLLRWIANERLDELHRWLARGGLARVAHGGLTNVVSCPGAETCKLAVTRSRGVAQLINRHFEARPSLATLARDTTIHVSGCPNGCALHHVATFGLQGGMRKVDGRPVPIYFLYAGGGAWENPSFGRLVAKLPARRVAVALERLVSSWRDGAASDESLAAFVARTPAASLRAVVAQLEPLAVEQATADDFIDLGEREPFVVGQGEGECAA
jgi:sulfite reductase (NADPH) hemoprotein beta-component